MLTFTLSDLFYNRLKKLTQVGLPALGSLYFGLSQIWGLPAGEEVVGSLALLTTFFGVTLGISSKNYSNNEAGGEIKVTHTAEGGKLFTLELEGQPEDLEHEQRVVFKVVDQDQEFWNRPYNLDSPTQEKHPL